jgi:hypothetical protein
MYNNIIVINCDKLLLILIKWLLMLINVTNADTFLLMLMKLLLMLILLL